MVNQYSTLFSTLYDEPGPVGRIGSNSHYSVLRSVEWLNVRGARLDVAQIHDFAVVWDEDHDTRVIEAINKIYLAGLLPPVQFIGERKGCLNIVLAACFYFQGSEDDTEAYRATVQSAVGEIDGDHWSVFIGSFDRRIGSPHQTFPGHIIWDDEDKVVTYLRNIDNLWNLGTKPYGSNGAANG